MKCLLNTYHCMPRTFCVCMLCLPVVSSSLWPRDCSPPGSSVHGILQAGILEWVAISFSRRSPQPKDRTRVSWVFCTVWQILYHWVTWEAQGHFRIWGGLLWPRKLKKIPRPSLPQHSSVSASFLSVSLSPLFPLPCSLPRKQVSEQNSQVPAFLEENRGEGKKKTGRQTRKKHLQRCAMRSQQRDGVEKAWASSLLAHDVRDGLSKGIVFKLTF